MSRLLASGGFAQTPTEGLPLDPQTSSTLPPPTSTSATVCMFVYIFLSSSCESTNFNKLKAPALELGERGKQ